MTFDGEPIPEGEGGGYTPAIPTPRTRHATLPAYAMFAEIHRRSFFSLQPLQPLQSLQQGKIAHQQRHLQADT